MLERGAKFWEWADRELHSRCHDERLTDGELIDIQSRLSRDGTTQLFIGVYREDGRLLLEEYYPAREGQTISHALAWGADRARMFVAKGYKLPMVTGNVSARPKPTAFL